MWRESQRGRLGWAGAERRMNRKRPGHGGRERERDRDGDERNRAAARKTE